MNDKEWLLKIDIAYKVYKEKGNGSDQVEDFIDWLYQQYGIVHKDNK
jgi:hypothetical protein